MDDSIAVVGAGLAGLTLARSLAAAGRAVTVYEKSRGPGGRMATRRALHTAFDHGAQYFTVRDPGFAALLAPLLDGGTVVPYAPRWGEGAPADPVTYVGAPGMASIGKALAAPLSLVTNAKVVRLDRTPAGWMLGLGDGALAGPHGRVALALPAPQVRTIAGLPAPLADRLAAVAMQPCLALLVAPREPLPLPYDVDWRPDPVLPFVSRNGAKAARDAREAWVLHADGDFSTRHLGDDPDALAARLFAAFEARTGARLAPSTPWELHRWHYARVTGALGAPYAFDDASGVGACGDWCLDARVEAAYLSGQALAEHLLARG